MKKNKSLEKPDYLLVVLEAEARKPIKGTTRLMKTLFLFEKEILPMILGKKVQEENILGFEPYHYGPFSKDLYTQIDFFTNIGFINVEKKHLAPLSIEEVDQWLEPSYNDFSQTEFADGQGVEIEMRSDYYITEKGSKYIESNIGIEVLDSDQWEIIDSFKRKILQLTTKQLLKYVYNNYPKYTEKSKILREVLGN